MEEGVESEAVVKAEKKHRKRQKKTLSDLRNQIEFYFSAPNLQKDRFLQQKLKEDINGCISIEVIASFNKMQTICQDITMVVKAMKMCPSVEVIEDKWVKPIKAVEQPKNVDPRTLYIEPLPPDTDHDWVKSVFSPFGNVVYVSLPRFKSTKKIKGFAFVEFEKESEAELALESFTKKTADECVTMADEEKQEKKAKKRKHKQNDSNDDENKVGETISDKKQSKDVSERLDNDNCGELSDKDSSDGKKKRKNSQKNGSVESNKGDSKQEQDDSTRERKRKRRSEVEEDGGDESAKKAKKDDSDSEEGEEEKIGKQKKHRKRKRKKKEQEELPDLKVISKVEWLRLKGEYKKLQRQAMKKTKTNLKKQEGVDIPHEEKFVQAIKHEVKKEDRRNRGNRTNECEKNTVSHLSETLERLPGVVLKYTTKEMIQKPALRELFSSIAKVAYLECGDNQNTGYVRFKTSDECEKIVEATKNESLASVEVHQLTEKEDIEYWEKLNVARKERFQQKKEKKRGIEKIVAKAEARAKKRDHIHFEDD